MLEPECWDVGFLKVEFHILSDQQTRRVREGEGREPPPLLSFSPHFPPPKEAMHQAAVGHRWLQSRHRCPAGPTPTQHVQV